jgi:hypothetical protein
MISAALMLIVLSACSVQGATPWLTKEQIITNLKQLCDMHPSVASYENVGKTVLGNDIWLFRFGTNTQSKILIDGATHGYEVPGSHSIYFLARWLLNGSTEANNVLSRLQILLVPFVNYDQADIEGTRKNTAGVDLNRNHIRGWRNSSRTGSIYYGGPYPASEPETQTMNNLLSREKPKVYISIHDYGGDPDTNNGSFVYPRYGNETYTNQINTLHNRYTEIIHTLGFEAHGRNPAGAFGSSADDGYMNGTTLSFLWEQTQTYTSKPETVTYDLIYTQKWHHLKAFTIATAELYGATPLPSSTPVVTPSPTPTPTPTIAPTPSPTPTPTPTASPNLTQTPSPSPSPSLSASVLTPEIFYATVAIGITSIIAITTVAFKTQKAYKKICNK